MIYYFSLSELSSSETGTSGRKLIDKNLNPAKNYFVCRTKLCSAVAAAVVSPQTSPSSGCSDPALLRQSRRSDDC